MNIAQRFTITDLLQLYDEMSVFTPPHGRDQTNHPNELKFGIHVPMG